MFCGLMSRLLLLFSVLLLAAPLRCAGQINWSSAILSADVYSNGAPVDGQMTFELGVFVSGFTPTAANRALWAANWRRASVAFYNPQVRQFTGVHQVAPNAAPFTAGVRGYIWGHTGQSTGGEWIMMSAPAWTWPAYSPLSFPVTWTVSLATETLAGQVIAAGVPVRHSMRTELVSAPLPSLTWTEWRSRAFNAADLAVPATIAPEADPDGDGVPNLAEYALGTQPRIASPAGDSIRPQMIHDGTRLRAAVTIARRADRVVGCTVSVSRDLQLWHHDSTVTVSETPEAITLRENLTTAAEARVFLRPRFFLP
jgi:hypothetical protein